MSLILNLPLILHSYSFPSSVFTAYQLPVDLYTSPVILIFKLLFYKLTTFLFKINFILAVINLNYILHMKKLLAVTIFAVLGTLNTNAQQFEFKVVTSVESIVPNGLGRSRIISAGEERDYKEFTSVRSDEDDERNKSDRGEIRVKNFEETKLLNFYNIGGIRFQNI